MDHQSAFSVIIPVYKNDVPDYLDLALHSVVDAQTIKPSEVVLIIDGPVSEELSLRIKRHFERCPSLFKVIALEKNGGLGNALRIGVECACYPICARMDSDDISVSNRFEKQLSFLQGNPDVDIVGGQICEFVDSIELPLGNRVVECTDVSIKKMMKSRCPFNHMTVMFRRESVLKAGNYQDWFWNEDYYLWIRMALNNCKFANLPEVLCYARSGDGLYYRRGGLKYFKSEQRIQQYMLSKGVISPFRYCINSSIRFIVQVLLPNRLRGWFYKLIARTRL